MKNMITNNQYHALDIKAAYEAGAANRHRGGTYDNPFYPYQEALRDAYADGYWSKASAN